MPASPFAAPSAEAIGKVTFRETPFFVDNSCFVRPRLFPSGAIQELPREERSPKIARRFGRLGQASRVAEVSVAQSHGRRRILQSMLESEMAKVCTTCAGARRIWRSTNRSWWQAFLGRPPKIDVLCPECNGIGVIAEPGDDEKRRQIQEHGPKKPLSVRELAQQYDEKQELSREEKRQKHQFARHPQASTAIEKQISKATKAAERKQREAAEAAQQKEREAGEVERKVAEKHRLAAENARQAAEAGREAEQEMFRNIFKKGTCPRCGGTDLESQFESSFDDHYCDEKITCRGCGAGASFPDERRCH